ncbi:hypothetical protein BRARA_J02922 [Brassica rapa]|uniref:Uncharacterized protein n=1 Tax=Brassica campestris TaxID=3711 RepID=A0A397XPH2_BRACM|nr:hypothetical protein BRARA_J02922 [Brassica rapa]
MASQCASAMVEINILPYKINFVIHLICIQASVSFVIKCVVYNISDLIRIVKLMLYNKIIHCFFFFKKFKEIINMRKFVITKNIGIAELILNVLSNQY